MQLQVHLHQCLLHMLDVRGRIVQQPFALAQIIAQCSDPALRTKAGSQQPILVQTLQPLCVAHVALAAGHMFGISRIHQNHGEAALLQDFEDGDPVNAGGLHGNCGDPALLEPVGKTVQVSCEGAETADRFRIAVRPNSCYV